MKNNDNFDLYSKKVMKYFLKPVNMGKIKNPSATAIVGNPKCGDVMKVYLKIGNRKIRNNKEQMEKYIKDIKVQTLGCGAAIATSSIATEMVKGKSLENAMKLTNRKVVKELGGLPAIKYHCSILAEEAIKKAIKNYQNAKND